MTAPDREALMEKMLLAISEHHSGSVEEGRKITTAALTAIEENGFALMPVAMISAEPLGAEFERVWDANTDKLYEG